MRNGWMSGVAVVLAGFAAACDEPIASVDGTDPSQLARVQYCSVECWTFTLPDGYASEQIDNIVNITLESEVVASVDLDGRAGFAWQVVDCDGNILHTIDAARGYEPTFATGGVDFYGPGDPEILLGVVATTPPRKPEMHIIQED